MTGLKSDEEAKRKLFQLAEKLQTSTDAVEQNQIKEELARIIFGIRFR